MFIFRLIVECTRACLKMHVLSHCVLGIMCVACVLHLVVHVQFRSKLVHDIINEAYLPKPRHQFSVLHNAGNTSIRRQIFELLKPTQKFTQAQKHDAVARLPGHARRFSWLVVHGAKPTDKDTSTARRRFPNLPTSSDEYRKAISEFMQEDLVLKSPIAATVYTGNSTSSRRVEVIHGVQVQYKHEQLDTSTCIVVHEPTFMPLLSQETNPFHFFGDTWHAIVPLVESVVGQRAFEARDLRIFLTFEKSTRRKSWIARGWGMAGFYSALTRFPLEALGSIRKPVCFKDAIIGPKIGGRKMHSDVQFYLKRLSLFQVRVVPTQNPQVLLIQRQTMDESHFYDAGRTILNIHAVDTAMRDAYGAAYLGSLAFELMPLSTSLNILRMADIVVLMHGAGHSMAAAFMQEGAWLLELSWACRDTVLKNTGKVIKGRNVHQRNYVVPKGDIVLVPRAFIDVGSHYVGSMLSGVVSPPACPKMFPHPFHTLYGNSEFGWWCGKHELRHDHEYNDECRMNVVLKPVYVVKVVNITRLQL